MPASEDQARTEYLRSVKEKGCKTVIIAWRAEWGPDLSPDAEIDYNRRCECRLLAYQDGEILAHDCLDIDRQDLVDEVTAAGLQAELRCRNMNGFGDQS